MYYPFTFLRHDADKVLALPVARAVPVIIALLLLAADLVIVGIAKEAGRTDAVRTMVDGTAERILATDVGHRAHRVAVLPL